MTDYYCDNCEFLQDKSNDNIIDGYCKKYNQSLTFYDWFEKCDKCLIETLQSENAALRERLEKAVELPFHPDDYHIELDFARLVVSTRIQGCKIAIPIYAYINCEDENSAEARLAELKGGKE